MNVPIGWKGIMVMALISPAALGLTLVSPGPLESVTGVPTIPSWDQCEKHFDTGMPPSSQSGRFQPNSDVELYTFADRGSIAGKVKNLSGHAKWLGAIHNLGTRQYDKLHVGVGEDRNYSCIWFGGEVINEVARVYLITPPGMYPTTPVDSMWVCTLPGKDLKKPYAHWEVPAACDTLRGYNPAKGEALVLDDSVAIAKQLELLALDTSVPWVSCASDGCCRIKL